MERQPTDKREKVSTAEYFKRLRERFNVNLIYYPASGRDPKLFTAFKTLEVVLLDNCGFETREEFQKSVNNDRKADMQSLMKDKQQFVFADYNFAPFKDGAFDAIFYNCCYSHEESFKEMLRTLKVGGIVIFGTITVFDSFADEDFERLDEVELPFANNGQPEPYFIGQKIY